MRRPQPLAFLLAALLASGCEDTTGEVYEGEGLPDIGGSDMPTSSPDTGSDAFDMGTHDLGSTDAGELDAGGMDAGDAATPDATLDMGPTEDMPADIRLDAGSDQGMDMAGATADAGADAGSDVQDAGTPQPDMNTGPTAGDCISGATGTHAVRFHWRGSQGSTAYVGYDVNELPDTSRWKAAAYARSFSYTPTFGDTFLGIGGLIFDGTTFMDLELSTTGISNIRNVTLAILGRSYNTTASGSFSWQSFDGSGAAPRGLVANSAPYQWYLADATSAFAPGNSGVLFRIYPDGPSNSLVVNSVELCFDAD